MAPLLADASVLASLDRTTVTVGDSVQLTISAEGEDGEPDLSVLQRDFEIVGRSRSSQFSFINGRASSKTVWRFTLLPRREGDLTIPPIRVGSARSAPLTLKVVSAGAVPPPPPSPGGGGGAASGGGDLFLEAEVTPARGYVQQQRIYIVRLFRAVNLAQAQLSEPKVTDALVVRLGDDRNREVVRGGRRYLVTERRYAIFPQRSGRLEIGPVRLDGRLLSSASLFDPFNQFGRVVRRNSNRVMLEVTAVPANWPGGNWLPARKVLLTQQLSDGPYKVGEPITRTVVLRATGLTAAQLPQLLDGVLPDGLKRYPDQPQTRDDIGADGVTGERWEKVAIIPLHGGSFILPGIDIAWWNSVTGRVEHATLPPQTIHVQGSAPATGAASASSGRGSAPPPTRSLPALPSRSHEAGARVRDTDSSGALRWWQGATVLFALLWLATLVLWRRTAAVRSAAPSGSGSHNGGDLDETALRAQVRRAIDARDEAEVVWALAAWKRHWQQRGVSIDARFPSLAAAIAALHSHRYGGGDVAWDGGALSRAFDEACQTLDGEGRSGKQDALPGLYD